MAFALLSIMFVTRDLTLDTVVGRLSDTNRQETIVIKDHLIPLVGGVVCVTYRPVPLKYHTPEVLHNDIDGCRSNRPHSVHGIRYSVAWERIVDRTWRVAQITMRLEDEANEFLE